MPYHKRNPSAHDESMVATNRVVDGKKWLQKTEGDGWNFEIGSGLISEYILSGTGQSYRLAIIAIHLLLRIYCHLMHEIGYQTITVQYLHKEIEQRLEQCHL